MPYTAHEPRHYTCLRSASDKLLAALRREHAPIIAALTTTAAKAAHN